MKTFGAILLVAGTLTAVSSLVVTIITTFPVTTGIFAFVTLGTMLLETK